MQRLARPSLLLALSLSLGGVLARPYPQGGSQDGYDSDGTSTPRGGGMAIENTGSNQNPTTLANLGGNTSPFYNYGGSPAGATDIEEEDIIDIQTQNEYYPGTNVGGTMEEEPNSAALTPPASFTFDTGANNSPAGSYQALTDNEYDPSSPGNQDEMDNTLPTPNRQNTVSNEQGDMYLNFNPGESSNILATEILPSSQFEASNNIVVEQDQQQQEDDGSDDVEDYVPQDGGVYEEITIENEGTGENMQILTVKPDLEAIEERRRQKQMEEENARAWANSHPRDRQTQRYQPASDSPVRTKVLPDYFFEPERPVTQGTQSTTRIVPDPGNAQRGYGVRKRPTRNPPLSQHPFAQSFRNMLLNQGGMNAGTGTGYSNQGSRENPINLENANANAPSFRTAQNIFQSFNQGMNSGNSNNLNMNSSPLAVPGLRRSGNTGGNNPTNQMYTNFNRNPLAMTGVNVRNEADPFGLNLSNAQRGTYQTNSYQPNTYQSILDQIPRVGTSGSGNNRYFGQIPRIQPLPGQGRQRTTGTQSGRPGPRQAYVDYSRVNTSNMTPEQISELFQRMEEQQARLASLGTQQPQTQSNLFSETTLQNGGSGTMAELAGEGVPTGTQISQIELEDTSVQDVLNNVDNPLLVDSASSDEAQPGTPRNQQPE
ncbi:hypothetical protein TWF696_003275 [Orbilia brochopaga]|uniref:Enamelin n=1 Tax=Orbilia brochopaga TaxID=3140254 RepID=A0AAV9U0F2_9PEZI